MKTLRDKLKPTLVADGVFYPNTINNKTDYLIILKEINKKTKSNNPLLDKRRKVLGFEAYQKLTGEPYQSNALISKKGENYKEYIILDNEAFVDYAENIKSALDKAYEYLLGKILNKEILECQDVYTNLLDTTKIGIEKFKKMNINKANLSAKEKPYIIVDKSKATHNIDMKETQFTKKSRLNH
jgi:hypothetical protein